jgi:hypothetical protein
MSVVHVVREYSDELEADLLEFFGVDLLDLWRGRLSIRRLNALIRSLMAKPGRSALLQAVDERASWSESEYMMARVSDALELSNFMFLKANSESTDGLEMPEPITRPGTPEPDSTQPEVNTPSELINFFGQMNSL